MGTQKKRLDEKPRTHVKHVKTDGNNTLVDLYLFIFIPERIHYNKLINNNHVTCIPRSNAAEVISKRSTLFGYPLYTSDS